MVNNRILQMLTTIRDDWTDEKVVAQSYSDYIANRISVLTSIRNDIMIVASSAEQAYLNNDEEQIRKLKLLRQSIYNEETVQYLNDLGCIYITQYTDMYMPGEDGKIYSVRDMISGYIYSVENDIDQVNIEDIGHTISSGFDEIMAGVNDGIGINNVIIEALNALAQGRDASEYLQRLQSILGSDTFTSVSQFAVSAYDCVKGDGKITDKVRALLGPITSVVISKNDSTNTIENFATSSLYTGMSPATFWIDSTSNAIEKAFQFVFKGFELMWKTSVAILKFAVKLVVSIWNKFFRKLFITDDIQVNDSYNCNYFNIPYSTTFIPWQSPLDITVEQPKDTFERMFGVEVTNDELKAIFSDGYALEIPFNFGCIRLSKYSYNYPDISDSVDGVLLQAYVTPNSPINGLTSFVHISNNSTITTLNMSLNERFNQLFVDSETETDIKVNQNDKFYWKAFKVSLYRLDFVTGLITNLTSNIPDSDFDIKGSDLPSYWNNFNITDNKMFNLLAFGATVTMADGSLEYVSPLVTNLPKSSQDTSFKFGYNRDVSLSKDPTNNNFFNLVTNAGNGQVVPVDLAMSRMGWPIFVFGIGPWLAMNSIVSWIYSTSAAGMMKLYGNGSDIPSSFIPYFQNSHALEFKYTLQSDEENRKAFNRALTTLVVTAVVITVGVVVTKGLIKSKYKISANKLSAEWNYSDAVRQGASPEVINQLYDEYVKSTKAYNRFNKLMGLTSSSTTTSNLADILTNKTNTDLNSIIELIK